LIFNLSQRALDLNFDGLMIETHWDPDNAWSDAKQQVTPARLVEIMNDLKIRKETTDEESYQKELETLREQIDVSDQAILDALGKRMKVAELIGQLKKDNNVAVLQNKRWNEILETMQAEGGERDLSEEFITRIFKAIHQESINHQEKVING
jgi:chorismate mutase